MPRSRTRLAPVLAWIAAAATVSVLAVFFIQAGSFKALNPPDEPAAAAPPPPQQITASRSTITGFDKESQPYRIAAENAVQDAGKPHVVHLEQVAGALQKTGGETLDLHADRGFYDTKLKTLELSGNVMVDSKNRFTASLEKATVIVEEKRMTSASPVVVTFSGGTIAANGTEITDNGKRIRFTGGVQAKFTGTAKKEDSKQ